MSRSQVFAILAEAIPVIANRASLVAIDGVDGAGKTVFADAFAGVLAERGCCVVRASVDGFHRPRSDRYARGRNDPAGYFLDSYDYDALTRVLLSPLKQGAERCRTAVFDHLIDQPIEGGQVDLCLPAVLLIDGIFLHRPELAQWWDFSIFLDVPFAETYRRMALRDGCPADHTNPSNERYFLGQRLYLEQCDPKGIASAVVDNTDWAQPVLMGRK